jgi:hypothetical protein
LSVAAQGRFIWGVLTDIGPIDKAEQVHNRYSRQNEEVEFLPQPAYCGFVQRDQRSSVSAFRDQTRASMLPSTTCLSVAERPLSATSWIISRVVPVWLSSWLFSGVRDRSALTWTWGSFSISDLHSARRAESVLARVLSQLPGPLTRGRCCHFISHCTSAVSPTRKSAAAQVAGQDHYVN